MLKHGRRDVIKEELQSNIASCTPRFPSRNLWPFLWLLGQVSKCELGCKDSETERERESEGAEVCSQDSTAEMNHFQDKWS